MLISKIHLFMDFVIMVYFCLLIIVYIYIHDLSFSINICETG